MQGDDTIEEYRSDVLDAAVRAWPVLQPAVMAMIAELTESLIEKDNPEVRGQIKGLRRVLSLPEQWREDAETSEPAHYQGNTDPDELFD